MITDIPPAGKKRIGAGLSTAGDPLPMAADPQSPAAEAFRFAAGSVERLRVGTDDRLAVAFVSAATGAERSTVVANVALAIALRSPHNSHLHIVARMGLVGIALWIALWVGWYWRLLAGCRRLAREGLHTRRQVAVLSMMVNTAVLVSCVFDPQLEGPQAAALLWTSFGIGVAVTMARPWFRSTAADYSTSSAEWRGTRQ